jgi:glycosyltransferase involved in cell wall biosynthesis
MSLRIVSIQHGDYREALHILETTETETYFGMRYSVEYLEKFLESTPHLIFSLNAPAYSVKREHGELVGATGPHLPRRIPRRIGEYLMSRRILKRIEEFRPTHVLIRTGMPILVTRVLQYCKKHNLSTLVVFASYLFNETPRARRINAKMMDLLNQPFVFKAANANFTATQSLIEAGLDPAKAIAWDWPGQREASDYPVKELTEPPYKFVFAGSVTYDKGVGDIIDAAAILHSRGVKFELSIIGAGPDVPALKEKAAALPEGMVNFKGRLPNSDVFQAMLDSTLTFVPSRHSFPEAMPLTLTEGLASRTPLVTSDHPIMTRAFKNYQGMRWFRASDPTSMADIAMEILGDPAEYRRLSETTADGLAGVRCPTSFGDLLDSWKASFPSNGQA